MTSQSRAAPTRRPLSVLLELLGRRWALRLLWELRDGALSFSDLRRASGGLSQSVQTVRLAELRSAGLVTVAPDRCYALTPSGRQLVEQMGSLDRWADGWAGTLASGVLDDL